MMTIELADGSALELPAGTQLVDVTRISDARRRYTLDPIPVQVRGDELLAALEAKIVQVIRELRNRGFAV